MATEPPDTDTSLAILASLLEPTSFPLATLIDALAEAQGDPAQAAEQLLLPKVQARARGRVAGKRKAGGGSSLADWLTGPLSLAKRAKSGTSTSRQLATTHASSTTVGSQSRSRSRSPEDAWQHASTSSSPARKSSAAKPAPTAPPIDLLTVLKQPDESKTKLRAGPQPPILLSTQSAIDKHGLPLTILQSPLSPSFASALYLTMMAESEKWERHRWYLAGKWVESPHTMTSYARAGGGHGDADGLSTYYYSGSELSRPEVSEKSSAEKVALTHVRTTQLCSRLRRT